MAELHITIRQKGGSGVREIVLDVDEAVYADLVAVAKKRGLDVSEMIGEALRLERVFADSHDRGEKVLIGRGRDDLRELVAV